MKHLSKRWYFVVPPLVFSIIVLIVSGTSVTLAEAIVLMALPWGIVLICGARESRIERFWEARSLDGLRRLESSVRRYVPNLGQTAHAEDTSTWLAALSHLDQELTLAIGPALERERILELILEHMGEGILLLGLDGRIRIINQRARDFFGIEPTEILGDSFLAHIRNAGLFEIVDELRLMSEDVDHRIERNVTLYGKQQRTLKILASRLNLVKGSPGILVVLADVSTLVRLESVRSDFVANVSHELRTPLTSLRGFSESLLDGGIDDPATARRFVEIIHKQASRLEAIIEDLLLLSRLDQQEFQLELERCDLEKLVREGVELCAMRIKDRKTRVVNTIEKGFFVHVHPHLFEQALINLVDNAVKYGPEGGTVQVGAIRTESAVEIRIRDEGPGIPYKDQARLFERFYRVDRGRSRDLGGTGLGLAIVKHIALVHQGDVFLESTLGEGSVFGIRLPLSTSGRIAG